VAVERCAKRLQANGHHAGGQARGGQHPRQPEQELVQEDPRVVGQQRGLQELQDAAEVLAGPGELGLAVAGQWWEPQEQLAHRGLDQLGPCSRQFQGLGVTGAGGPLAHGWWPLAPARQELGCGDGVRCPPVGAKPAGAQVVRSEGTTTGQCRYLRGLRRVDRPLCTAEKDRHRAADDGPDRADLGEQPAKMVGRGGGSQEGHLPAVQPQHLGHHPRRQRMPLAFRAGDYDMALVLGRLDPPRQRS
jgi:hypothetical protein